MRNGTSTHSLPRGRRADTIRPWHRGGRPTAAFGNMARATETGIANRAARALRWLALLVALAFLLMYVALAIPRMLYPFALEWMEGGSVEHVRRILQGRPLYVPPSPDYVPYIYTPLYYYAGAAVAKIVGVGFLPLRIVSFVCSLGCFATIGMIVRRETKNTLAAILAMCLFAATFRRCGAFFDIARADSQCLLGVLLGIYCVRFAGSWRLCAAGGLCLSLAALTKQTALFMGVPLMLYAVWTHWRRGLVLVGVAATVFLGSTLLLNHLSGGWYRYYTTVVPARHTMCWDLWPQVLTREILGTLPVACLLGAFYVYRRCAPPVTRTAVFFPAMLVVMVGASFAGRINYGGYDNTLFPGYAILAIVFGPALHESLAIVAQMTALERPVWRMGLFAACILQFGLLTYDPRAQVPTPADRAAGRELVDMVRRFNGDVFIPYHVEIATMAGKPPCAHFVAMDDVLGGFSSGRMDAVGAKLVKDTRAAIRGRRYAAVILCGPTWPWLEEELHASYRPLRRVFEDNRVFWPVTGGQFRPERVFVPR